MAELADAHDSKSCSFGSVGSTPTIGIIDFEKEMSKSSLFCVCKRTISENTTKYQAFPTAVGDAFFMP